MVKDRPRGILTSADREFLRMGGERWEEYTAPNRSQRWQKIEERTRNGIDDLTVLHRDLPGSRREKVFSPLVENRFPWSWVNALADSFGFQLLGFLEELDHSLDDEEAYERVFEKAIERTLSKQSGGFGVGGADISVDVAIDDWAAYDELPEHEDLSELRPVMLRSLLNAGEITDEEFARAILAQSDDGEE